MKKSLLVISVILLIAGLFISCNSEAAETGSDLAYVKFADDSKGLDSSITTWVAPDAPPMGSLKWYYKASKASGAQVGARSAWTPVNGETGLSGQIGPFSVGNWKFELIGCDPNVAPTSATALENGEWDVETTVKYAGVSGSESYTSAADVKLTRNAITTIPVAVARFHIPTAPQTITLKYNVSYNAGHNDALWFKVFYNGDSFDSQSGTPSDGVLHIDSPTAGIAQDFTSADFSPVTVSFKVYEDQNCSEDFEVAEGSVTFPGLKGSTVTISGTLDDLAYAYGEFGTPTDLTPSGTTYQAYILSSSNTITPYTNLDDAISAANDGDTVVMLNNVDFGTTRSLNLRDKAYNVNLAGYTLTTDSEVDIDATNNGYKAAALFTGLDDNASSATVSIKNGTIKTAYGAGIYTSGENITVVVDNVVIRQNYPENVQTAAEYSSAIRVTYEGKVIINSGTFTGKYALAVSNSGGDVTINGGTFNSPLYFSSYTDQKSHYDETRAPVKKITINGGSFTHFGEFANIGKGNLVINGGTFDADPTAYVDTDLYNVNHTDSTWTVTPKSGN